MRFSAFSAAIVFAALAVVFSTAGKSIAQDDFDIRWANAGEGDWLVDANWVDSTGGQAFPPDATFEEGAFIGNGGTAVIDSSVPDVFNLAVPAGTIDIRQGGSLSAVGSGDFARDVSVGASGTLMLTGNGSLTTASQSLNNSGLIWLGSSDTTFNVGGNLNQNGTLRLDINAGGTPKITGGDDVSLRGTILANFDDSMDLQFGDTFEFLSGASSVTNFGTAVTLPAAFPLASGLDVQVVTPTNSTAALQVSNLPVLTLHRVTGAASISNVVGGPLSITSYEISSGLNLLNPDGWNSLSDQGNADWTEANPRIDAISELNFTGELTLEVNDSVSLGNVYNGGATHPTDENTQLIFTTPDGRILEGLVEYEGPANDLVLNVNDETGEVFLQNFSSFIDPIDLTGYSILSASGSLVPEDWVTLAEGGREGWTEGNPQTGAIAELNPTSSTLFTNGSAISLGNIFNTAGSRDLTLQFTTPEAIQFGTVEYGAPMGGMPGDCNGDGVVNAVDLECVTTIEERDIVLASIPTLPGDLDGNGQVAFPDFLTLSNNFGRDVDVNYTLGDVDVNGVVAFPDFLTLSNNFGKTPAAAAAVPEPASGMLGLLAVLGLAAVGRKRINARVLTGCLVVCLFAAASVDDAQAIEFDGRFIKVDTAGPTGTIDSTNEAREIVRGNPNGALFSDEVFGDVQTLDLAGDAGNFPVNTPYLNGVNDSTMDDFLQYMQADIQIPEGDWTIGFGSDDGGFLRMPGISFSATFNENGSPIAGDGEIIFNAGRGHGWTTGQFSVPAGGVQTYFETLFFERGGGDSFEVAILNGLSDTTDGTVIGDDWSLLSDGVEGWTLVSVVRDPGDFNFDGAINLADAQIMADNWGTGSTFAQGDNNRDGKVDQIDFVEFRGILASQGATTAAVPEPASWLLMSLASVGLLLRSRRNRR